MKDILFQISEFTLFSLKTIHDVFLPNIREKLNSIFSNIFSFPNNFTKKKKGNILFLISHKLTKYE